ncbi:hypothetical protein B0H11DRAFT_2260852 [Mycena galericulata]|nr:hypothetical protein B0H11DRAFT_2260852 [Mycena galericulata]
MIRLPKTDIRPKRVFQIYRVQVEMSDDGSYEPSAASSPYSLHLDYEMSQHHQPIREAREAEMTTEELEAVRRDRHHKRVRKGYSPPSSPIKQEGVSRQGSWTPPRPSAVKAVAVTGKMYAPGEIFDSQTGDNTYVENHENRTEETQQEGGTSQQPDDEPVDSDFELETQINRLQNRLNQVVVERDELQEERDEYRRAYHAADAERKEAVENLRQWQKAAAGSAALINLALPFLK